MLSPPSSPSSTISALILILDPAIPIQIPVPLLVPLLVLVRPWAARLRSDADAAGVGLGEKGFGGIWALGRKGVRDTKDARYAAFPGPKGAGLDVCARSNIVPFRRRERSDKKEDKVHGSEAPAPGEELATGSGRAQSRAQISPRDAVLPRKCGGRKKEGNVGVEGRNDAKEERGRRRNEHKARNTKGTRKRAGRRFTDKKVKKRKENTHYPPLPPPPPCPLLNPLNPLNPLPRVCICARGPVLPELFGDDVRGGVSAVLAKLARARASVGAAGTKERQPTNIVHDSTAPSTLRLKQGKSSKQRTLRAPSPSKRRVGHGKAGRKPNEDKVKEGKGGVNAEEVFGHHALAEAVGNVVGAEEAGGHIAAVGKKKQRKKEESNNEAAGGAKLLGPLLVDLGLEVERAALVGDVARDDEQAKGRVDGRNGRLFSRMPGAKAAPSVTEPGGVGDEEASWWEASSKRKAVPGDQFFAAGIIELSTVLHPGMIHPVLL
ncbi:hypothetical protein B0H16DRAFT_1700995 [Mycena metata]|uniref:Uncharacterized protein n=1 Tax=Mycena metata TaxID=1033252 RepID=A0AAD7HCZ6_9AGAR|nr:hypothetical protein B0H16DRAFT_1700995 [Mycena metata]